MTKIKRIPRRMPDSRLLAKAKPGLEKALKQFGWPSFRDGQRQAIIQACGGMDNMVLLPTGKGKSGIYLAPAVAMDWPTLVFCPLLALMKDQVESAAQKGIRAAQLSSDCSDAENRDTQRRWKEGQIQVLFSAPERMNNEDFASTMRINVPKQVAVDEAHVIHQWGDTFRSSYSRIGSFLGDLGSGIESIQALTATATDEVQETIRDRLDLHHAQVIIHMVRRENLLMSSSIRTSTADLFEKVSAIKGSVIVYCATTVEVEDIAAFLQACFQGKRLVNFYHGKLPPSTKQAAQDEFMRSDDGVIVATNAFGMGVDKSNVRGVILWQHGPDIESIVQEFGRAGRDELISKCHVFGHPSSIDTQRFLIQSKYPPRDAIEKVFKFLKSAAPVGTPISQTAKDIAYKSKVAPQIVGAVLQGMARFGIVDKAASDDDSIVVTLLRPDATEKAILYSGVISKYGKNEGVNKFRISKEILSQRLGVQVGTAVKYISDFSKAEPGFDPVFEYEKSYRGNSVSLKEPNLDKFDFDYLSRRFRRAMQKMEKVTQFISTPDEEKQDFLDEYFGVKP